MTEQECISCLKVLPIDNFEWQKNRPSPRKKCKSCRNSERVYSPESKEKRKKYAKKYAIENKDKLKDYHLKYRYGLSLEKYNEKLSSQDNLCSICNKDLKGRKHLDHNHETGQVRGILCSGCNTGLGMFLEDKKSLERAIEYLTHWEII